MAEPDPEKEIDEQYELPDGWMWTKIGEIGKLYRGVSYKKEQASKEPKGEHVPILRANNINFCINLDDLVYVPLERVNEEQFIRAGDIIICMSSGSKNLVGKAAQAENKIYGGFGTFCAALRVNNMINKKYVGFFFQSSFYRNVISQISRGVNINNLRQEHIDFMHIPLPPLPEQHRIVAKLEALLAQVNHSKDHLAKVTPLIKRFRQSVLAAACSGRLTEDWRREHPDVEPASELLNRVREERIRRYEEECRKAELEGRREPKKPKNIEPQVVDMEGLPELPEGWVWVVFDQIAKAENNAIKAGPFGSSLKKEFYVTKQAVPQLPNNQ